MCTDLKSNTGLRQAGKTGSFWRLWIALIVLMSSTAWAQLPPPVEDRGLFGEARTEVVATSDVVLNFTLMPGSLLTGKVTDSNGAEFVFGSVFAESMTAGFSDPIGFAFDPLAPGEIEFKYRMVVPDDLYTLSVESAILGGESDPSLALFLRQDLQDTVTVSGNTVRDITIPSAPMFFTIQGTVTASATIPATGLLSFLRIDGTAQSTAESNAVGANGSYETRLPAGDYHVFYGPDLGEPVTQPPPAEDPPTLLFRVGMISVSADGAFNIVLPEIVTLAGTIEGLGMPSAPASVFALAFDEPPLAPPGVLGPEPVSPAAVCQGGAAAETISLIALGASTLSRENTDGMYRVPLVSGTYEVAVEVDVELELPVLDTKGPLESEDGALTFPFPPLELAITADQVQDFVVSKPDQVVMISGTVVDDRGLPVANAEVSASSRMLTGLPNVAFNIDTETGVDGRYRLPVYSGVAYTVTVCPPDPTAAMFPFAASPRLSPQVLRMMNR